MADQKPIARGSSSPASPGIGGAIRDAIAAISGAAAPKAITQRKQKIDAAVDDAQRTPRLGDQF